MNSSCYLIEHVSGTKLCIWLLQRYTHIKVLLNCLQVLLCTEGCFKGANINSVDHCTSTCVSL